MMNQTNLAYKLEPQEALLSQAANAASVANLLRGGTRANLRLEPKARVQKKKRAFKFAAFQDNYSGDFRAFRVY